MLGGNRVAVLSYAFWTRRFSVRRLGGRQDRLLQREAVLRDRRRPAGLRRSRVGGHGGRVGPHLDGYPEERPDGSEFQFTPPAGASPPRPNPAQCKPFWMGFSGPISKARSCHHLPVYFRRRPRAQHLVVRPASAGFSAMGRRYERPLVILLAVVTLVLLISCGNVANLVMARNSARAHEINVRLALRRRRRPHRRPIVHGDSAAGLGRRSRRSGIGHVGLPPGRGLLPQSAIPLAFDFRPNLIVLGFTAAIAVTTTFLFGLAPALRAARTSQALQLKSGSRTTGRTLTARILVAGQLALSLLLLIAAGLFLGTVRNFKAIDLGFRPDHLVTFRLSFPRATPPERIRQTYAQVRSGLRASPGIVSASYDTGGGWSATAEVEGRPARRARTTKSA